VALVHERTVPKERQSLVGEDSVALLVSLPPDKTLPTTSDLIPPTFFPALRLQLIRKLAQQTSAVAHVCTTATGRPFITYKWSKRRFLNDTGSHLCMFPRKLILQRRSRIHYDHCAANGTTIPTYGLLPLSLNLGLSREHRHSNL
jgi:hypothetical protein